MTDYPLLPQRIPRSIKFVGLVGLIMFILLQIVPIFVSPSDSGSSESSSVLTREEATTKAVAFAKSRFNEPISQTHTVHQSDSMLYGYLSKEQKLDSYGKTYDSKFPTDTFQTEISMKSGTLFVQVHMESGQVTGWTYLPAYTETKTKNNYMSDWSRLMAARQAAVTASGFRLSDLKDSTVSGNVVTLRPKGYTIGDAALTVKVTVDWPATAAKPIIFNYEPKFNAPVSYTSYVQEQKELASTLSLYGSMLMNALLFLLAIITAIRIRKIALFRRGLVLCLLFLGFYIANNYNMADGIRATLGIRANTEALTAGGVFISNIVTVLMGLAIWFSLVTGDGLWRRIGKPLWLRYGEPGYGRHVWSSMKISYPLAFALLGAQTILLLGLDRSIGSWSTTSVDSSPYNMALPLLFPLLAWCAAISEEALYRLFGIALFERLFRRRFLGCLMPTVIWALGHVSYPVFPAYSRLIELTIVGLLFCWIFIRFGFITAVFTHAILDTVLMSFDLLMMGSAMNVIAAVVYLVLPVAVAWVLMKVAGRREAVG
ncbi:CAAX prenyl protease-like protein [Paenibacillus cellulosilyticus]|uniref:CAAX prenyl protease-like protein n=1 Tax=Paenibacillus cellulosilyticus TaxID=375489 RepID=A0A2V2YAI3_9BACL|nr:CPBP family intramembrane glutamic endopeptidase [Paenibacillus cellulosilyticus]PWV87851.1 CAAX prenyl protease-like protein [Paenibacillus cellulosilyticus]QKS47014.1 CPBP family intramembrane metalloprotease [Paenibacillus cellulosilyticus]